MGLMGNDNPAFCDALALVVVSSFNYFSSKPKKEVRSQIYHKVDGQSTQLAIGLFCTQMTFSVPYMKARSILFY